MKSLKEEELKEKDIEWIYNKIDYIYFLIYHLIQIIK